MLPVVVVDEARDMSLTLLHSALCASPPQCAGQFQSGPLMSTLGSLSEVRSPSSSRVISVPPPRSHLASRHPRMFVIVKVFVGAAVGDGLGALGDSDGLTDGELDGLVVGGEEGRADGASLGDVDGELLGASVGAWRVPARCAAFLIDALRACCLGLLARRKRRGLSVPLANVGGCFFFAVVVPILLSFGALPPYCCPASCLSCGVCGAYLHRPGGLVGALLES